MTFISVFQTVVPSVKQVHVNKEAIRERIGYLEKKFGNSKAECRKDSLTRQLQDFLLALPSKPSLMSCSPVNVVEFLVWKDGFGKTKVHEFDCPFLGKGASDKCYCPSRLAVGTIKNLVSQLGTIFEKMGRASSWSLGTDAGNPAKAPQVSKYVSQVSLEQAQAHVLPKQAKPIFLDKLKSIAVYIDNQLSRPDLSKRERFVLLRDQAFFKLQFFAADRASDLSAIPSQEVKRLNDNSGFLFCHTLTKSIRGGCGKANKFVIKRCSDKVICPIEGLEKYVSEVAKHGVTLSLGYLFRLVSDSGRVLNKPVSFDTMYDRLLKYLVTLGVYEGETPHSFRAGCAIMLGLSGAVKSEEEMMNHVGWFSESPGPYYSRVKAIKDASVVATRLSASSDCSGKFKDMYVKFADTDLGNAFM